MLFTSSTLLVEKGRVLVFNKRHWYDKRTGGSKRRVADLAGPKIGKSIRRNKNSEFVKRHIVFRSGWPISRERGGISGQGSHRECRST